MACWIPPSGIRVVPSGRLLSLQNRVAGSFLFVICVPCPRSYCSLCHVNLYILLLLSNYGSISGEEKACHSMHDGMLLPLGHAYKQCREDHRASTCTMQRQVCETHRSSPRCRLMATLTASSSSFNPQDEISNSKATTSDELLLPEKKVTETISVTTLDWNTV